MRKVHVSETKEGIPRELIFDSISIAINYLQAQGYSDYEISKLISFV